MCLCMYKYIIWSLLEYSFMHKREGGLWTGQRSIIPKLIQLDLQTPDLTVGEVYASFTSLEVLSEW